MLITERIIVSVSILWAIAFLLAQVLSSRGNRRDFSVPAGSPLAGVIYNFTWAMLPQHKESIRLHPGTFTIGILMHLGIFYAIIRTLLLIIDPTLIAPGLHLIGIIPAIGAFCGIFLLIKRIITPKMKLMSSPDDYISILLTLCLCGVAAMHDFGRVGPGALMVMATIVFIYMPFGKLKHAIFFFIARADYGYRLGYRGTYPSKAGSTK
jgi:nitrate reductase gamma subunit